MSLLDSNKRFLGTKSGKATVDLTSTAGQGNISFGGSEFNTFKFVVSGITDGLDIILNVRGGITDNYTKINTYDEAGELVESITTNGTYYAKCTGLTGVYFSVTRTANGTATVKWSLSKESYTYQQTLNDIVANLGEQQVLTDNQKTLDLSSPGIKYSFPASPTCKCLVVRVFSITTGASLRVIDTSTNYPTVSHYYTNFGEIYNDIHTTGVYYIPINVIMGTLAIYVYNGTEIAGGSAKIKVEFMKDFPEAIFHMKPVQTLLSVEKEITAGTGFLIKEVGSTECNPCKFFKYYFIHYTFRDSNNVAVLRSATVYAQPYYALNNMGAKEEIHSSSNAYTSTSKWIEMKSTYSIRFTVDISDFQAGDRIKFEVYGIR